MITFSTSVSFEDSCTNHVKNSPCLYLIAYFSTQVQLVLYFFVTIEFHQYSLLVHKLYIRDCKTSLIILSLFQCSRCVHLSSPIHTIVYFFFYISVQGTFCKSEPVFEFVIMSMLFVLEWPCIFAVWKISYKFSNMYVIFYSDDRFARLVYSNKVERLTL